MQPLWKAVWRYLKKLKMGLSFDPAISLLGIYPKDPETPIQKNICTLMFIGALISGNSLSPHQWTKKLWYIYTMEYY